MSEPIIMKCGVCGTCWTAKERDLGLEQCPHAAVHAEIARLRASLAASRAEAERLTAEALRFYLPDGSYETLATPEEVVERRIEAARTLDGYGAMCAEQEERADQLEAEVQALTSALEQAEIARARAWDEGVKDERVRAEADLERVRGALPELADALWLCVGQMDDATRLDRVSEIGRRLRALSAPSTEGEPAATACSECRGKREVSVAEPDGLKWKPCSTCRALAPPPAAAPAQETREPRRLGGDPQEPPSDGGPMTEAQRIETGAPASAPEPEGPRASGPGVPWTTAYSLATGHVPPEITGLATTGTREPAPAPEPGRLAEHVRRVAWLLKHRPEEYRAAGRAFLSGGSWEALNRLMNEVPDPAPAAGDARGESGEGA